MKTSSFIPSGHVIVALASAAVISPTFGQLFHRRVVPADPPPPIVREEQVLPPGRPLLRPEQEPQVVEIIPESEARAREKRAKEAQRRGMPPATTIIEVPRAIDAEHEGSTEVRKSSGSSTRVSSSKKSSEIVSAEQEEPKRTSRSSTVKKSSEPVREEQVVTEEPRKTSHSSTVKRSPEPVHQEQVITEEPRKTPKRTSTTEKTEVSSSGGSEKRTVSSSEKRETDDAQRQIEQLQKKVNDLQNTVAETKKETVVDATPPATVSDTPTTPVPVGPGAADTRQPIVVDTPPEIKTENTTVQTESSTSSVPTSTRQKTVVEKGGKGDRTERTIATEKPGNIDTIPTKSDVPVATKTDKDGFVTSPYPPHNVIDATGLPKGSLAKDPSTNKVFRVP